MAIIYSDDSDLAYWPQEDLHDPQSSKYYFIDYRPDVWQANKPYIRDLDIVIPVVSNGCMYECISGGVSSSTAPSFSTSEGKSFQDSGVIWRVIPYSARLGYGDVISSSTWSASEGVTIGFDEIIDNKTTAIKVISFTNTSSPFFDLINVIEIIRSTGRTEKFKKTLRITSGKL